MVARGGAPAKPLEHSAPTQSNLLNFCFAVVLVKLEILRILRCRSVERASGFSLGLEIEPKKQACSRTCPRTTSPFPYPQLMTGATRIEIRGMRFYQYIGPEQIANRASIVPSGTPIRSPVDVMRWIQDSEQDVSRDGSVIATFVIDESGLLLVADRRSEHVSCAGRQKVRSAGEITFVISAANVEIEAVSNQSTGYCPEPESWPAVSTALLNAGFEPLIGFALSCIFRLCPRCGIRNLVKEHVLECAACRTELPAEYNCQ